MSHGRKLFRLGPFPLSGERVGAQIEAAVYRVAGMLGRIRDCIATPDEECGRLASRALEPWRSSIWFVVRQDDAGLRLLGVHVCLGSDFVTEEWTRIESEPPLVRALMVALTGQLWWRLLREFVTQPRWQPLLALEWCPDLAQRGGVDPHGAFSLLSLSLERGRARHTSRFRLVAGWELVQAYESIRPVGDTAERLEIELEYDNWWTLTTSLEGALQAAPPVSRSVVRLERFDGVALPLLDGWPGAELELLPRSSSEQAAAVQGLTLQSHGLASARRAQLISGTLGFLLSLVLGVGVVGALEHLSRVRTDRELRLQEPSPLPALSFCSEDNQRFVNALQDWLIAFSPEPLDPAMARNSDLTPLWCGLLARQSTPDWNPGLQAPANACFDVLRTSSYGYQADRLPPMAQPGWGDPKSFFETERTRIPSLQKLVSRMQDTCRAFVRREEDAMKGAIVRAHLDPALVEVHPLLTSAAERRPASQPEQMPSIWTRLSGPPAASGTGMGASPGSERELRESGQVTQPKPGPAEEADRRERWLQRYVTARFAPYRGQPSDLSVFRVPPSRELPRDPLWACYLSLLPDGHYEAVHEAPRLVPRPMLATWNSRFFFPTVLEPAGPRHGVRSQLQLDATLHWFSENELPSDIKDVRRFQCWAVVRDALDVEGYEPAHPLFEGELEAWPAEDQQVCGQVCQAVFGLETGEHRLDSETRERWYSPELDLSVCLTVDQFRDDEGQPSGRSLELDMGWAGLGAPTPAQACAFHLLAQGRLPTVGEGQSSPLGSIAPRAWAGNEDARARTSSKHSFLVYHASQMSSYMRHGFSSAPPRSVEGCRYVSAECLTATMLRSLRKVRTDLVNPTSFPADLQLRFADELALSQREDPWCRLIDDELAWLIRNDFRLDEKRAEDVCLSRIAAAHGQVTSILKILERTQ